MSDTNNGWPDKPGVPLNPEQSGWHWIYDKYLGPECALWIAKSCCWQMAGAEDLFKSDELSIQKWRYLGPVLSHDAAMALQARVAELERVLLEARDDLTEWIDAAHPHREKYPHIMKDFENDMEIVRRIDAAMEGGKKDE